METIGTESLGSGAPIDTLAVARYLQEKGVDEKEAEGHAEIYRRLAESLISGHLATKTDIAEVRRDMEVFHSETKTDIAALKTDIARVEATLKQHTEQLCQDTKRDMKEMEYRMTIKLGTIVAGIVGFFMVMDKFF